MDSNQRVFDEDADVFTDMAMMPAERAVLRRLAPRIHELEMLDLGVGTGRTSWTYASLVKRYVGVDYAPRMIEAAKRRLGEEPNVELILADARDLSRIEGDFDYVLFSYNAIDAVAPDDRHTILDQVHSKLKPCGLFQFSTHNLGALPFDIHRPPSPRFRGNLAYRLYSLPLEVRYAARIRKLNRQLDLERAHRQGWDVVASMAHDFRLRDYYVDPAFQVRQLREHGFEVVAIFDRQGQEAKLPLRSREPWFDYLCQAIRPEAGA